MVRRACCALGMFAAWCAMLAVGAPSYAAAPKVLRIPMPTTGPKSLDPVRGSTLYENRCASQVYETLLQYKYLMRPPQLEPLLLAEMPKKSDDGLVYEFKLKKGVHFHDDPCFPGGKGREVVAADVFYSWKRMADNRNDPKGWWLVDNTIAGFDAYRDEQNKGTFDYEATVDGFQIINDQEFKVVLTKPVHRFMWTLAMFQLAVVPREAVEEYGERFGLHPVGTGPFILKDGDWKQGQSITFRKNPNYHDSRYPKEHMPEDEAAGLTKAAGAKLPFADLLEITFFEEPQPQWLKFKSKDLDLSAVPAEFFEEAFFKRTKKLKKAFADQKIQGYHVPMLDFIFKGFNMEDPLLGGYEPKKRYLRQAISLAVDWEEINDAFYNGTSVIYDGPIPPGLDGYPKDGKAPVSYRGPDIERAKELLAKAGYPDGKGLPVINFYTSTGGKSQEQVEMMIRQIKPTGIRINPRLVDFGTLIEAINKKQAQFFSFAWGSDYPDGENNLALFYSPNVSPGANHFNYKSAKYDKLYEEILVMGPSPARTKIYDQMRDMLIEDAPFAGSMARVNSVVVHPWVKNYKPTDTFDNWYKYLDVDQAVRGN